MFKMLIRLFWIFPVFLCGGSSSAVLNGKHFSDKSSNCSNTNEITHIRRKQVPRVQTEVGVVQDVNVTTSFHVRFIESNIMAGNIKWIFTEDEEELNVIIRLSFIVNDFLDNTKYFLIHAGIGTSENNGSRYAKTGCIKIPPAFNTTIKAEVYRINMTSCSCDVSNMATHSCLHLCHMYHASSSTFLASRDACHFYREHNNDELSMILKAEMISANFTRFRGYFTNVNPFCTAHVSVFPDDYQHFPHVPIVTFLVKVNAKREILFSGFSKSLGYTEFYAKLKISCSAEDFPDEYFSETATVRPYREALYDKQTDIYNGIYEGDKLHVISDEEVVNDGGDQESIKMEVVYGIVTGLICICCVVTVIVWLKLFLRKRRRNERTRNRRVDLHLQLYTANKFHQGKTSRKNICQNNRIVPKEKHVMILYHPDTTRHKHDVDDFILCLQKYHVNVHVEPEIPFQNWRDFAEKAGEQYNEVIIVLSKELIELCEIYKKRGCYVGDYSRYDCNENVSISDKQWNVKRWNELLEQRQGEYIPCVALDKLRSVIQDRRSDVEIHCVTFCDTDFANQNEFYSGIFDGQKQHIEEEMLNKLAPFLDVNNKRVVTSCRENGNIFHPDKERNTLLNVRENETDADSQENANLLNCINKTSESTIIYELLKHKDYCDFLKQFTFLQTKHTHFHTLSRKVIRSLLLSENNDIWANTVKSFSLVHILETIR